MPLSNDEIDDLKSMLKLARKRELNFGLCLDNNPADTVLLLHRSKSPDILLRRAQAIGDTPKQAKGHFRMEGKTVLLDCDADAPPNCARQLRLFLREMGISVQVRITDPSGVQDGSLTADAAAPVDATAIAPFKKTLTVWTVTKTKMAAEMTKLQTSITEACANDPTLASIVAEAAELPARLDVFDGELDTRLTALSDASDTSSLDALKAQARATVQEYETALNDPFFADLDTNNGFVKIAVSSSAKQALAAISKVLT